MSLGQIRVSMFCGVKSTHTLPFISMSTAPKHTSCITSGQSYLLRHNASCATTLLQHAHERTTSHVTLPELPHRNDAGNDIGTNRGEDSRPNGANKVSLVEGTHQHASSYVLHREMNQLGKTIQ